MFKNVSRYGIYNPYILTVSIIVAVVMFVLHDFFSIMIGLLALLIAIMTLIRNAYRYHLIQALIHDQKMDNDIHVLDLATKKGYSLIHLANQAKSAFVDGLEEDGDDFTAEALKNVQKDSDISRVQINHGDVRYLPYDSNHFDTVTIMPTSGSRFVSRHEIDYQAAFKEAIRVLAPRGRMLVVMPRNPAMRGARYLYSQDKMIDVYIATPDYQLLLGYQPIVIKKKAVESEPKKTAKDELDV